MNLKIYKAMLSNSIQRVLIYRTTSILIVVFSLFFYFLEMFSGMVYFSYTDNILGWTKWDYFSLITTAAIIQNSYSFFSSHAANTFSIAILFSFIVKNKTFTMFMVTWSIINCYTRLYLGLHYPSDIIVGLVYGSFIGSVCYVIYCKLHKKTLTHEQDKNAILILPKYEIKDIQIVLFVFSLLFSYILIKGLLLAI